MTKMQASWSCWFACPIGSFQQSAVVSCKLIGQSRAKREHQPCVVCGPFCLQLIRKTWLDRCLLNIFLSSPLKNCFCCSTATPPSVDDDRCYLRPIPISKQVSDVFNGNSRLFSNSLLFKKRKILFFYQSVTGLGLGD